MNTSTQPKMRAGTLTIDLAETERFLTALGGKNAKFVFQTFANNSTNDGVSPKMTHPEGQAGVFYGTLDNFSKTLSKLNHSHNGVFVTVNESTGGRKAENITRVRAVFADWDDVDTGLPAIAGCGLKPQIVVESSAGKFHAYWLVSDCKLEEFKPIQQAIAAKLGSDPAINDLPRVMRLVGFNHYKYADSPYFQTRIVEINEIEAYKVSEIKAGLGLDLNPAKKNAHSAHNNKVKENDNNLIKNNSIDKIRSALSALPLEVWSNHEPRLRIAMALKSHDESLLDVWLEFCKLYDGFNEDERRYQWGMLGERDEGGISIATLYYDAKKYGWIDTSRPEKFTVTDDGVFFNGIDREGQPLPPEYVCSMLEVLGSTSSSSRDGWGRYLQFFDRNDGQHRWAMPMTMLAGDGLECRSELLRLGLEIGATPKAKTRLTEYIMTATVAKHYLSVEKTGWSNKTYVLPHKVIGGGEVLYQSTGGLHHGYSSKGSREGWLKGIGALSAGNSRLVFAIGCAFAAPLLHLLSMNSAGFHFRGDSSCGKTTALRVAASVWGGEDYLHRWRATGNGLEAVASLHNDGLLILDELAQCDAREAGQIAYMLANGAAKVRSSKTLTPAPLKTWRLLYLSAGEISLSQHMQTAGARSRAGQEVRLIDIPADAEKGLGLFEILHGDGGGAAFSRLLLENCTKQHGRVGIEYLENLCAMLRENYAEEIQQLQNSVKTLTATILPQGSCGQVARVAEYFALVGVAGELATRFELTGWQAGEAEAAAKTCFNAWLNGRGGAGNHEDSEILSQVRSFFEAHGESRFTPLDAIGERTTVNRAGFREVLEGAGDSSHTIYYCLPEAFSNELCKGYDNKKVTAVLKGAGWLQVGGDGKSAQLKTIRGMARTRFYVISPVS